MSGVPMTLAADIAEAGALTSLVRSFAVDDRRARAVRERGRSECPVEGREGMQAIDPRAHLTRGAAERRPPPRVGLTMIVQLPPGRARLDVEVLGEGDPVVVIQTALHADELRPLATMLAEGGPYRVVHYHRRGYARSEPLTRPATDRGRSRRPAGARGSLAPRPGACRGRQLQRGDRSDRGLDFARSGADSHRDGAAADRRTEHPGIRRGQSAPHRFPTHQWTARRPG